MRRFLAVSILVTVASLVQAQDQPPRFQSSVDVTSVDVSVFDSGGRAVSDLQPSDFTVRIQGNPRRVVSAEWISLITPERPDAPPPPAGYSTNENSTGGRLIVFVIDQPNIRFGGTMGIRTAVNGFLDRLQASDRVAVVGIGPGAPSLNFTSDRDRVKKTIERSVGQRISRGWGMFHISISEAAAVRRGDPNVLDRLIARECQGEPPGEGFELCAENVGQEANRIAAEGTYDGEQTLTVLRNLMIGLRALDAPKTVVLVSEGFILDEQGRAVELGNLAAAARTSIYVLKLDNQLFDITDPLAPTAQFEDRRAVSESLEMITAATRGTLFNIAVNASAAFAKIESELAGYYLLGVESDPADKDGKSHSVRVEVNRRGLTVRSRREIVGTVESDRPRSPRQLAMAALGSPLMVSGLPLRVATFSLQGPEPSRVQLLIHAGIGNDYSASRIVSLGYVIVDPEGRIVDSQVIDTRLPPVLNGVPSSLQFTGGASLPPGDYTLKLAVVEGDRIGTVEHSVHATLVGAGAVQLSDLMVGGPTEVRELMRPTIGHTVTFGSVHGYLEAYGAEASGLSVKYEIATGAEAPALLSAAVPGRTAGGQRVIFSQVMLVGQLPPGHYMLRAILSSADAAVKTMVRDFEVAAPRVLMTSVEAGGAPGMGPSELFLPAGDELFARPFQLEEAFNSETVKAFRDRLTPEAASAFDEGVGFLAKSSFADAENSFKKAIQIDADNASALAYLATTFAASGHDEEAAGAWQTSLIDGADLPQIYVWLGDVLMRLRNLSQARAVLEEAISKWPSDVRFAKPLALLYATFGQGREAVRTLERHLAGNQDDIEANFLGVEWIYHLHSAGAVAHSRAEDVKIARGYASAYEKAQGPQMALVKEWMDFLEGRRR
jgi:VWFA-related protein